MRMSAYVAPFWRAVLRATSARAFLSRAGTGVSDPQNPATRRPQTGTQRAPIVAPPRLMKSRRSTIHSWRLATGSAEMTRVRDMPRSEPRCKQRGNGCDVVRRTTRRTESLAVLALAPVGGGNPPAFVTRIGHCRPIPDRNRTCLLASRCANYISESWHRNASFRKDVLCEARNSSQLPSGDRAVRVRQYLRDALHDAGHSRRNLRPLPPVLHREAEAAGYGRPGRAVRQEAPHGTSRELTAARPSAARRSHGRRRSPGCWPTPRPRGIRPS